MTDETTGSIHLQHNKGGERGFITGKGYFGADRIIDFLNRNPQFSAGDRAQAVLHEGWSAIRRLLADGGLIEATGRLIADFTTYPLTPELQARLEQERLLAMSNGEAGRVLGVPLDQLRIPHNQTTFLIGAGLDQQLGYTTTSRNSRYQFYRVREDVSEQGNQESIIAIERALGRRMRRFYQDSNLPLEGYTAPATTVRQLLIEIADTRGKGKLFEFQVR